MYNKGFLLNRFSGLFELCSPVNKYLLDDFIKSSPWCNVPEECTVKEKLLIASDSNGHSNGHL